MGVVIGFGTLLTQDLERLGDIKPRGGFRMFLGQRLGDRNRFPIKNRLERFILLPGKTGIQAVQLLVICWRRIRFSVNMYSLRSSSS